jgi:hypothetical protein
LDQSATNGFFARGLAAVLGLHCKRGARVRASLVVGPERMVTGAASGRGRSQPRLARISHSQKPALSLAKAKTRIMWRGGVDLPT